MAKLLLTILCATVLWKHAVSVLERNGYEVPRRKADLFLQNKAIPGLPDPDEGTLPRMKDDWIPGLPFVDPELKSAVLGGNYPESNLQIDKYKMPPPQQVNEDEDLAVGKQMLKNLILMDPVEMLLLQNGTTNDTEISPADAAELLEPKSLSEGLANFAKQMLECKNTLIFCKKRDIVACYLHCLLGKHPIGKVVQTNFESIVKLLCDPLGAIFDTGIKLFHKNFDNVKTINNFLTVLRIVPDTFRRYTRMAANAIPVILLKYSKVQEADLFKSVLSGLESDARALASGTDITSQLSNPSCPGLNTFNAIQRIATALFENPKVVDIFLPGSWMISKVFNLIPDPLIKTALKAFGAGLSLLVGVNCGLIHFIQTGSNATCEWSEHVVWEASEDEMVPPESGTPVVCGATPYIPTRILLEDTFPPVFAQEGMMAATGELSQRSMSGGATKDMGWMEEISNMMDSETDDTMR